MVVQTITCDNPEQLAYALGIILAGDYGVGNRIEETAEGYVVKADDGKEVVFLPQVKAA